jgi:hypothetical protein
LVVQLTVWLLGGVEEASGSSVKLKLCLGQGSSQLPGGRRYTVDLLVTSQAGGQISSSRETLAGGVLCLACEGLWESVGKFFGWL